MPDTQSPAQKTALYGTLAGMGLGLLAAALGGKGKKTIRTAEAGQIRNPDYRPGLKELAGPILQMGGQQIGEQQQAEAKRQQEIQDMLFKAQAEQQQASQQQQATLQQALLASGRWTPESVMAGDLSKLELVPKPEEIRQNAPSMDMLLRQFTPKSVSAYAATIDSKTGQGDYNLLEPNENALGSGATLGTAATMAGLLARYGDLPGAERVLEGNLGFDVGLKAPATPLEKVFQSWATSQKATPEFLNLYKAYLENPTDANRNAVADALGLDRSKVQKLSLLGTYLSFAGNSYQDQMQAVIANRMAQFGGGGEATPMQGVASTLAPEIMKLMGDLMPGSSDTTANALDVDLSAIADRKNPDGTPYWTDAEDYLSNARKQGKTVDEQAIRDAFARRSK